jgi:glycosyltransferase involved in cell wall biosynthesis
VGGTPRLSVVIPVYNEASHIAATTNALAVALEQSPLEAEVVLVDDGSTDGTAGLVEECLDGRIPLRIVTQPNSGRFLARRAGLEAASGELVMLLDGRVRLDPGAVRFVAGRVERGEAVWTAHVDVEATNVFGLFWRLLAELAWRDYFDRPRTTSFGLDDFDRFPKGTTCFLAPRNLLLDVTARFTSRYRDVREANDDTPVLRDLAARERIHVSPRFSCRYTPRESARAFVRHAVHRGVVFVDGHGGPESRFFPVVVGFFPLSATLAALSLRRPLLLPGAVAASGLVAAACGVKAGRSRPEIRALALATPVYVVAHGLGMWKGLAKLTAARLTP